LKGIGIYDSCLKVNNLCKYEEHLKAITKAAKKAGFQSLAEWELITWKSDAKNTD